MKSALVRLLFVAAVAGAKTSAAAEIDSLSVASGLTYGYARSASTSVQGELEIVPSLDLTLSPKLSLVASARLRLDERDDLEPGRRSYDSFSELARPANLGDTGSAELRDLYVEHRFAQGLARIGKQQIVWGRLDGIKVLDVVNPQDFREFILEDFGASRIGLWSAYLDYSVGRWRAEIALVPDGTGHAIPDGGAWYELTAPRFRFGSAPGLASLPVVVRSPGHSLNDLGFGVRLSRPFRSLEISAVAYTGRDPEPLGRIGQTRAQPIVERYNPRRDIVGLSFDLGLGSAVLRAEYGYQPDRVFNARTNGRLTTLPLDQHRGAIGIDVEGPLGVFLNAQYLVDSVTDAPAELVRPGIDRVGTLFLRRRFAYDTLTLEARWFHSFTDDDDLAAAAVTYALNDSTSVKLTAEQFSGTREGLFGQFAGRARVTVGISHTF